MIHELQKPLHMHTTRGDGIALFMIDNGWEDDLQWVVVLSETGEIWSVPNWDVRLMANWSYNREKVERPEKRDRDRDRDGR